MQISVKHVRILRITELAARDPYPPTHLVSLFQETTGELINAVCSTDCLGAIQSVDPSVPVTCEAVMRQIDLRALGAAQGGKAYKLRVTAVLPEVARDA